MDQVRIKRRRRSQAGFTLIEVMIGAFMFMFGCLGMLGLMNFAGKASHQSAAMTYSKAVASSYIARLVDRPDAEMTSGHESTNVTADGQKVGKYQDQDGNYAVSWTTTNHGRYFTVQVDVRWWDKTKTTTGKDGKSSNGEWQQYSLSTARQK